MIIRGFEQPRARERDILPFLPDPSQAAVLDLGESESAAVLGAPGTGKTTTLIELIARRVLDSGWSADSVLALATTRATATRLRDDIALRLGVATSGPLARTVGSLAFEVVGHAARRAGSPAPRLLTGADQDRDLASILAGHITDNGGPDWPEPLSPELRGMAAFRTELRELMMRATEFDLSPGRLRELGHQQGRPEWVAAAAVMAEYLGVVSAYRGSQLDASELARFAVAAIESGEAGERVGALRLVVVDDLQEATEATFSVLRAIAARGVPIVAFGDPDVATNSFRGGEPEALGRLSSVLSVPHLRTMVLGRVHRHGEAIRTVVSSVASRIGAAAAGTQRSASSHRGSDARDPVSRIEAPTPARQWATIARVLRERHLIDGVPWDELAVIVRSGANVPGVARALELAEVPTRTSSGGSAVRDALAARSLLTIVAVALGRTDLTPAVAAELLLGPFGGLDRLGLRRLRLALRAEELAGGGKRLSDELIVEALGEPGRFATIDHRWARYADRLATTISLVRSNGGSIEELLWLAWERSGVARQWREHALGGGVSSVEANRDLDGVVALFAAARRFAERLPDRPAGDFLTEILEAELPEDSLSPRRAAAAVLVATPTAAVGLEFDTVVVASVQDGVWPNLRPRGSLLAAHELVRIATGSQATSIDERKLVLDDELRMFALAVSRARERVVVSAVSNDDESPSVLFSLLPACPRIESVSGPPLSLRGMTGALRRKVVDERSSPAVRSAAASSLARLAELKVPGAHPSDWHGLLPISSTGPLFDGEPIPVSPSQIERIEESPLDWFIETIAGSSSGTAAGVGTILHWAMETASIGSEDSLWASVESRWQELAFDSPWLAERQRRLARGFTVALAEYLAHFDREGKQLVSAERRFQVDLGEAVVRGSIDRVERARDGTVMIVDLKTGSPLRSSGGVDSHPQLGAYQLAYASGVLDEFLAGHGEHAGGGAKLLFVKEGSEGRLYREAIQSALDDEGIEGVRSRIRRAARVVAAAEFEGVLELPQWGGYGNNPRLALHRVKAVSSA